VAASWSVPRVSMVAASGGQDERATAQDEHATGRHRRPPLGWETDGQDTPIPHRGDLTWIMGRAPGRRHGARQSSPTERYHDPASRNGAEMAALDAELQALIRRAGIATPALDRLRAS
jgi:hypothetical protein